MKSNKNIGIIVNSDDARIEIFDKVKFANASFHYSIKLKNGNIFTKPKEKYDSKFELSFIENHSKIKVIRSPRGSTRSKLHISEMAFFNDADKMLASALASVPKEGDITIETTANGFGNEFEKLRTKRKDK
jgi:phage FluMu gp28-like protein